MILDTLSNAFWSLSCLLCELPPAGSRFLGDSANVSFDENKNGLEYTINNTSKNGSSTYLNLLFYVEAGTL